MGVKGPKRLPAVHTHSKRDTHAVSPAGGTGRGRRCCTHLAWSTHTGGVPINHGQPPNHAGTPSPALTLESDFPGCLEVHPVSPLLSKGSTDSVFRVPWPSAAACPPQSSRPPALTPSACTSLGSTYLVASCCSSSICFLSTSLASVRATICSLSNCKDFRRREEKTK